MQASDRAAGERDMPVNVRSSLPCVPGQHPRRGPRLSHQRGIDGDFRFSASNFPKKSAQPCTQRARGLGKPRKDPWTCRKGAGPLLLCAGVQEEGGVELYGDMSTMPPREAANFMPVGACLREGP